MVGRSLLILLGATLAWAPVARAGFDDRQGSRSAASRGVLAVLHDLNLAAQYADRVLVLKEGEELTTGEPADTFTKGGL